VRVNLIIVDDDEIDRYLIARIARKSKYDLHIFEFESGNAFATAIHDPESEVADCFRDKSPAVALLDINMPGMSGFDVVDEIRAAISAEILAAKAVSVLICSSSEHPQDYADAKNDELICDYIVKPPTAERLDEIIAEHCT